MPTWRYEKYLSEENVPTLPTKLYELSSDLISCSQKFCIVDGHYLIFDLNESLFILSSKHDPDSLKTTLPIKHNLLIQNHSNNIP